MVNDDENFMVDIAKAVEDSGVLMKGLTKTLKNDVKQLHSRNFKNSQKGGVLLLIPMLLGTLGVSLLTGKGLFKAGSGNKCNCDQRMYRAGNQGKRLFRAGH